MRGLEKIPPVALFVYNRPKALTEALDALRINSPSILHVFTDGPREDSVEKVKECRRILRSIDWVEELHIHEREENAGLERSIRSGLDFMFEEYDRVVVLEDDVVVAPEFLRFMGSALEAFAVEESVSSVTGLRHPFDARVFQRYPFDGFFFPRFSSWGWGSWSRFWKAVEFDPKLLRGQLQDSSCSLSDAGADLAPMVDAYFRGILTETWAIPTVIHALTSNQLTLHPVSNLVRNVGTTGGTHFKDAPPWKLEFENPSFSKRLSIAFPEEVMQHEAISRAYLRFYRRHYGDGFWEKRRSVFTLR